MVEPDHGDASGKRASHSGNNLALRVASTAVLAPVALLGTFAGGWAFLALCIVAAAAILWEWTALVSHRADPRILVPGYAALLLGTLLVGFDLPLDGFVAVAAGVLLAGLCTAAWPPREPIPTAPLWAAGGVAYAGATLLGPALLRRDPDWGLSALLFLFATVWTTDILAYFCGRAIGGPALWPAVSPHKTWSGALGGLFGGVAAGIAVAYAVGSERLGMIAVMAFALSVVAQAGDLFESAVKRRFGAKDASRLIPGHGGLMDRLDGFLVAAFAALLIGLLRQGISVPARGLLVW